MPRATGNPRTSSRPNARRRPGSRPACLDRSRRKMPIATAVLSSRSICVEARGRLPYLSRKACAVAAVDPRPGSTCAGASPGDGMLQAPEQQPHCRVRTDAVTKHAGPPCPRDHQSASRPVLPEAPARRENQDGSDDRAHPPERREARQRLAQAASPAAGPARAERHRRTHVTAVRAPAAQKTAGQAR